MGLPAWAQPLTGSVACRLAGSWPHTAQAPTSLEAWAPGRKSPWKLVAGVCRVCRTGSRPLLSVGSLSLPCFLLLPLFLAGQACPTAVGHRPALRLMRRACPGESSGSNPKQERRGGQKRGRLTSLELTRQHRLPRGGLVTQRCGCCGASDTTAVGFQGCVTWQLSNADTWWRACHSFY